MGTTDGRTSRFWRNALLAVAALTSLVSLAAVLVRHYAEPVARRRILASVEEQLGTPAQLDKVHVAFLPGLRIEGRGLHVPGTGTQPRIDVASFRFATNLRSLFAQRTTLIKAEVQGLSLVVPPGEDHASVPPPPATHTHGDHGRFMVAQVVATDSELVVQNGDPAKFPLRFKLSRMVFDDDGEGKPIHFDVILANGRPIGDVHAHGLMGPCNPQRPRETPLSGRFDFARADLSSINGVQGHLSGQGTLTGSVGMLVVDGDASTPDFAMAPGLIHVALTSHFHAAVDALTGQFTLMPVTAHLLHTDIVAHGTVTRIAAGHDILLESELHGRAEDLLNLVSPTRTKPLLSAALSDRATIHIPPGPQRMLLKLETSGQATLLNTRWGDQEVQRKVNALSLRGLDKAKLVAEHEGDLPNAPTTLTDTFELSSGFLRLNGIAYRMPGATVLMEGSYNLAAETLDFHGVVRTVAKASQMTTGIRSLLLKPLDPLLTKPGAGMQMPVALTGPKGSLSLGLDLENRRADDRLAPAVRN